MFIYLDLSFMIFISLVASKKPRKLPSPSPPQNFDRSKFRCLVKNMV